MTDVAGLQSGRPRSQRGDGRTFHYAFITVSRMIEILANAAGVTYYALLALFPGIAAVVSIYGLFADPNSIVSHVDTMAGFAPGGAIDVIRDQLTRLSAQGSTSLGVSFLIGLVISLWSANSGNQGAVQLAQCCLRGGGKAQPYPAQCRDPYLHPFKACRWCPIHNNAWVRQ